MKTHIIYLRPRSSFIGNITSDTLFGAFCWTIRDLYGVSELKLSEFAKSPPFILSSPFPYVRKGNDIVRFFPKPRLPEITAQQMNGSVEQKLELKEKIARIENTERAKRMESAKFVSEKLFRGIVQGQLDGKTILNRFVITGSVETDIETFFKDILITTAEREKIDPGDPEIKSFWRDSDRQHNQIDRITWGTAEGRLFFLPEEVFLNRKKQNGENVYAGLWFYLRTAEDRFVQPLLRYLQDTGLGSERTKGKGHFTFEIKEETNFPENNEKRNAFISLSRYIPVPEEIDFGKKPLAYYLYVIRPKNESKLSGKDHRTFKGIIRGFEPGSVFPLPAKQAPYLGHLVQMGKNANELGWEVWHNGITLPVYAEVKDEI